MVRNKEIQFDRDDGLPLMEVGSWSEDKHILIKKFVHASWAARSKWPQRTYIDLFCGPGKLAIRDSRQVLDGSPLVAWRQSQLHGGAFTNVLIADLDSESVNACKTRLEKLEAPVQAIVGEATITASQAISAVNLDGLHLVVLDPFNIKALDFSILRNFSQLAHVDIILHFSVMDVQRNIDSEYNNRSDILEKFAPGWRQHVNVNNLSKEASRNAFLDYWVQLVSQLGFKVASRAPLFKNQRNAPLYRLVLLYRHQLAQKLWNDVARNTDQKLLDL